MDYQNLVEYSQLHNIPLKPARAFVEGTLLPWLKNKYNVCVGFNLPFDLSRLAISVGPARKKNYGGFSFKMSENIFLPRIIIKNRNNKGSFISLARELPENRGNSRNRRGRVRTFKGNFLDLRTLCFALTDQGHSLESACKYFKADTGKTHPSEHGKITADYIDYNRNDVKATYSLYKKVIEDYKKFNLNASPLSLASPASIGKACLDMMEIDPFMHKNPRFPRDVLGKAMSTYYGGRSEVRVRRTPMQVALIDFLSMYPTMCILQNLWKFVIASKVDGVENTEKVQAFVDAIKIEDLSDKTNWQKLNSICLIQPDKDILPIRAKFFNNITYNIGINHITSEEPMWYALADVVSSKILNGKTPKILMAISFHASGVQKRLKPITLIGGQTVDPNVDDFYIRLMNYRQAVKEQMNQAATEEDKARLDTLQRAIKVITNATCYGIFIEMNPRNENMEVSVYGLNKSFDAEISRFEEIGPFFNPILATMITASSRLVLAITEGILQKHHATYAFCDTDSMAVPEQYVDEIQSFFQKLSPYEFNAKLFKLEKENFHPVTKVRLKLWFYGISAKRYVLYYFENGIPVIRKHSLHGLGHILNPFRGVPDKEWEKMIWTDVLTEHYDPRMREGIEQKYGSKFMIQEMSITSMDVMKRFKVINKDKTYFEQVKPFNFFIIGEQVPDPHQPGRTIRPMAPYTKDPQKAVTQSFIDYSTGKVMRGVEYWKPMSEVYNKFKNHKEAKFAGDVGVLNRRDVRITSTVNIGKESNNLDDSEVLGVKPEDYQIILNPGQAQNDIEMFNEFIKQLRSKTSEKYGISKRQLIRMQNKVREGVPLNPYGKTMKKLNKCYAKEKGC